MNPAEELKKVKPVSSSKTLVDQVEEHILDYFRTGNLKPGDAVPSETELAKALNVGRSVVREALSRLRMLGLVESRTRRGMILKEPDILIGFERAMEPNFMSEDTLQDIIEIRLVMEMGLAELLFMRITDRDIKDLENIVNAEILEANGAPNYDADIKFHSRIFQILGNDSLARFQALLLPVFFYVRRHSEELGKTPSSAYESHRDILNELKCGTPDSYRKMIKKYSQRYFDHLQDIRKRDESKS